MRFDRTTPAPHAAIRRVALSHGFRNLAERPWPRSVEGGRNPPPPLSGRGRQSVTMLARKFSNQRRAKPIRDLLRLWNAATVQRCHPDSNARRTALVVSGNRTTGSSPVASPGNAGVPENSSRDGNGVHLRLMKWSPPRIRRPAGRIRCAGTFEPIGTLRTPRRTVFIFRNHESNWPFILNCSWFRFVLPRQRFASPILESLQGLPSCASMIGRLPASPVPMLFGFVVLKTSKRYRIRLGL